MKKVLKLILGIVGASVTLLLLFILYWAVAPDLIGPKQAVENVCSAIEPGTTTAELSRGPYSLYPISGTVGSGLVQVDLQLQNGWVCICQVEMENGEVLHPNDVFCSD